MPAVTITGARGTGNVASGLLKPDIDRLVHNLQPNAYPFTVITRTEQHSPVHNPDFDWFETDQEPRADAINNGPGYTNADTSLVVDNGSYFAAHDHVRVLRTGEVFRVTSVSTNTLTVVRGIGGGAAALNDNDELLIIGSAQIEGDTSRAARSGNPTKFTDYCQIHRNSVEMTETMRNTDVWTSPDDWTRVKNEKFIEHQKNLESAALFGRPNKDTSGTHPRRTTGGLLYRITTNITAAGGTLTEAAFFTWARTAFRYGSKSKLLLASRLLVDVLNAYARGKVQFEQSDKTYGVRIFKFISPHGDINMVVHDMLEGTTLGGYGILVDTDNVKYRPLQNRDTDLYTDRQAPDQDTQKQEWISEVGQQVALEKTHALLTGVTG